MTPDPTDNLIAAGAIREAAPAEVDLRRATPGESIVTAAGDDGRWYKDAIIYQLHVRAFQDSDGDGIGDFRGLAQRLDYIQDLGVTALWLLPFYPSPLRDDGYDIADYRDVHPSYGTLKDFQAFLREAHARGLKVITELVLNHTSEQHPWFQRARRAPLGSRWRNFYVWSDTPERYADARIIFQDFETSNWTWDPVAKQYFWHRFYAQQPDLNWDSPDVQRAMFRTVEYWLRMGVDGLRLDAVPYLYEREGTSCENLPETHAALRQLRQRVDERYTGRMLLAEANQWPEDAVAYFGSGDGDECHMAFNFPLMPRMFMAIEMEDRFPVNDILQQTPPIPPTSQWAVFLRNHDELTLEMVTDEERDYMYRSYARERQARVNLGIRRRLSPLLENDPARLRLMNALLFSLPGTPIIYYGDEVGMGDNIYLGDRNGVRTPMQWSGDRNAGFSNAAPQALYLPIIIDPEYHYEKVNVESQLNNTSSLLWWMRRMIALRKRYRVFGRGELTLLHPDNNKVLALVRHDDREKVLVVANLSRHAQFVELDLSAFEGTVPVELFGGTAFPPVGGDCYRITLSPHSFFWLSLEAPPEEVRGASATQRAMTITVSGPSASAALGARSRSALEMAIKRHLPKRRWFAGKAKTMQRVTVVDLVRVDRDTDGLHAALAIVDVDFTDSDPDRYVLPLAVRDPNQPYDQEPPPNALVAEVVTTTGKGIVYDATYDREFCAALMEAIGRRRRLGGPYGHVIGINFDRDALSDAESLEAVVARTEQTNTSILYGSAYILKLFRRIESGINPDLELGRVLNTAGYEHVPTVAGALEYRTGRSETSTLALLQELVPHESEAWTYTLDVLGRFYEKVLGAQRGHREEFRPPDETPLALSHIEPTGAVREQIGNFLDNAALLGARTAEMHVALASNRFDPALKPEPITALYQRSVHQSIRTTARRAFQLLRRSLVRLSPDLRDEASAILEREDVMLQRFHTMLSGKPTGMRIRCHGDFHLGQVLYTGRDFVILDFEGEPARPLSERRIKRSPLRDVAGMVRSFHYATHAALAKQEERGAAEPGSADHAALEQAGAYWYTWVTATYLSAYRDAAKDADFLPAEEEYATLLEVYLLDKAAYEVSYELNNRPDWLHVPLRGIRDLLVAGGLL